MDVNDIINKRLVSMVFQPVFDLASGDPIGFEALARGPQGTPLESAEALVEAAAKVDRLGELDWVCRAAAIRAALASGLPESLTWFINAEPAGDGGKVPADLAPVIRQSRRLRVVIEITEREVAGTPGGLLELTDRYRGWGWGIALDDVGARPDSLALLPLIAPDVVKLDLRLVHRAGRMSSARVANAVRAYAESTGAAVIAEGVETEAHREAALVLGASYAQGFQLGRPGPLPAELPAPRHWLPVPRLRDAAERRTPFQSVSRRRRTRQASRAALVPMSRSLERQALDGGESYLVLSGFQDRGNLSRRTRDLYTELAGRNAYVAAIGLGMDAEPEPGVVGIRLDPGDPLSGEWLVIVIGPHFAAALVAQEIPESRPAGDPSGAGGPGDAGEPRFEYVITHDRDLVIAAARSAFRWITAPASGDTG